MQRYNAPRNEWIRNFKENKRTGNPERIISKEQIEDNQASNDSKEEINEKENVENKKSKTRIKYY